MGNISCILLITYIELLTYLQNYSKNIYIADIVIFFIVIFFSRAIVGEIDEEVDKRIDMANVKAAPLAPIWINA